MVLLEVRKLDFSKPMVITDFLGFKIFRLLMTFRLLDKSTTISLALLPPPSTSLVFSSFGTKFGELIVFNIEISGTAIYLKS